MKVLRVLIADDEALLRLDLREMLEEAGHTVVGEAENGKIALELAEKEKPDLVIMDVKMPVMDGLAAAKIIGEKNAAPVLLLTAYSQQDIVKQATDSGVFAYLVKPIREEELFPAIEIAISRFEAFRRLNAELDKAKDDLETRKLLDRAKGILMDQYKFTEKDAFQAMQKLSMDRRLSLKAVARAVIASAEIHEKEKEKKKSKK
ncbi:MAG: response regulator [Acidaminococcaceae bacterium]|nr:response regulator [Acidaminococcaceae bacterium]MBQ9697422.1 response regulator [Acidaminococcaceae bacterium]MBR1590184.1 response regulator [Acidaminococcaceae bacterium]